MSDFTYGYIVYLLVIAVPLTLGYVFLHRGWWLAGLVFVTTFSGMQVASWAKRHRKAKRKAAAR